MIFVLLFIEFFKTGLFAVGGGLATIPFLRTMGESYGWFDENGNQIVAGNQVDITVNITVKAKWTDFLY